jgi:hypothetical protein
MREIKREGNGQWLWMEMTLILMWKIVSISQRLFLNGDVDICLLFFLMSVFRRRSGGLIPPLAVGDL